MNHVYVFCRFASVSVKNAVMLSAEPAKAEAETEAPAPENLKNFILDFSAADSLDEVYDEINARLGFDGFGRSLSAFTDLLRGGFGHFNDEQITLTVVGRERAKRQVKQWADIEEVITESVEGEYGEQVKSVVWIESTPAAD